MGDMITKPDANPILLAVLNFFPCALLPIGYFMMGQSGKAIAGIVYIFLLSFFGIGSLLPFVFDAEAGVSPERPPPRPLP